MYEHICILVDSCFSRYLFHPFLGSNRPFAYTLRFHIFHNSSRLQRISMKAWNIYICRLMCYKYICSKLDSSRYDLTHADFPRFFYSTTSIVGCRMVSIIWYFRKSSKFWNIYYHPRNKDVLIKSALKTFSILVLSSPSLAIVVAFI